MMDFNFSDFARHFPTVIKASTTTNPSTTAPAVPVSPLGTVSKVPAELVIAILLGLDISSLLRFRHVSRQAREFVSTLFEYRAVVEVAAPLLLSTVRSGISDSLTIASLYRAICSTRCHVCGEVGHLIYLLTAERCCWHCIQNKRAVFRTVTLASFSRTTKRSKKKIQQAVPLLRGLKPEYHQAVALINFDAATRALGTDPNVDLGRGFQHFNEGTMGTVVATTYLPLTLQHGKHTKLSAAKGAQSSTKPSDPYLRTMSCGIGTRWLIVTTSEPSFSLIFGSVPKQRSSGMPAREAQSLLLRWTRRSSAAEDWVATGIEGKTLRFRQNGIWSDREVRGQSEQPSIAVESCSVMRWRYT